MVEESTHLAGQPRTPRGAYGATYEPVRDYTLEQQRRVSRYRTALLLALMLEAFALFGSALFVFSFGRGLFTIWPTMYVVSVILVVLVTVCLIASVAILQRRPNPRVVQIAVAASLFSSCICVVQVVLAIAVGADRELADFGARWNSRVKSNPAGVCAFQASLKCTGWKHPCNSARQATSAECPTCHPHVESEQSCYDAAMPRIVMFLPIVCVAATAAAVGLVAIAALLWKLQRQSEQNYDPLEDEFF